jgi:hypothetical protein
MLSFVALSIPLYLCSCFLAHQMAPSSVGHLYYACRYRYNMFMSAMSATFFAYATTRQFVGVDTHLIQIVQNLWVASKALEWIDTVFLLMGKKQVRVIHYWHHMSTVTLFSLSTMHSGMSHLSMFLNSGVHMIMYRHYARPFPYSVSRLITEAQIGQFVIILTYYAVNHVDIHRVCELTTAYCCSFVVLAYFALFVHMYYYR